MRILSVTTGRSDVGLLEPVWREIGKREDWKPGAWVLNLGSHQLSAEWNVHQQMNFPDELPGDSPVDIVRAMGRATQRCGRAYRRCAPDVILVAGDRYEALAAVSAALLFNIPVAHIGGGDETIGSYDNQFRHAITKMAHMHFVAHPLARERLLAMGEESHRVHLTGLPSLDGIRQWLENHQNAVEYREGLVVIFHPPTLDLETVEKQARELGRALLQVGRPVQFFVPGRDVLHETVRRLILDECEGKILSSGWTTQQTPGQFYQTLASASCLVGNSSAGIIEACAFGLPVVDIGTRQAGRVAPSNVLHAPPKAGAIVAAIRRALSLEFRSLCQDIKNPYGDGHAAERIVAALADLPNAVAALEQSSSATRPMPPGPSPQGRSRSIWDASGAVVKDVLVKKKWAKR